MYTRNYSKLPHNRTTPNNDPNNESLQVVNPQATLCQLLQSLDSHKDLPMYPPRTQLQCHKYLTRNYELEQPTVQDCEEDEDEDEDEEEERVLVACAEEAKSLELEMQKLLEELNKQSIMTEQLVKNVTSNNDRLSQYRRLYQKQKQEIREIQTQIGAWQESRRVKTGIYCPQQLKEKIDQCRGKPSVLIPEKSPQFIYQNPSLTLFCSKPQQPKSHSTNINITKILNTITPTPIIPVEIPNTITSTIPKNSSTVPTMNTINTVNTIPNPNPNPVNTENRSGSDWSQVEQGRISIHQFVENSNLHINQLEEQMRVINKSQTTMDSFDELWASVKLSLSKPNSHTSTQTNNTNNTNNTTTNSNNSKAGTGHPIYKKVTPNPNWATSCPMTSTNPTTTNSSNTSTVGTKNFMKPSTIRRRLSQRPTNPEMSAKKNAVVGKCGVDAGMVLGEATNRTHRKNVDVPKICTRVPIFNGNVSANWESSKKTNHIAKMDSCRKVHAVKIDVKGLQAK